MALGDAGGQRDGGAAAGPALNVECAPQFVRALAQAGQPVAGVDRVRIKALPVVARLEFEPAVAGGDANAHRVVWACRTTLWSISLNAKKT